MKIKYIHLIISGVILLSAVSCKKSLDKSNVNPNASQTAQPDYFLTAATKQPQIPTGDMNSSLLFLQHWVKFNILILTGIFSPIRAFLTYGNNR